MGNNQALIAVTEKTENQLTPNQRIKWADHVLPNVKDYLFPEYIFIIASKDTKLDPNVYIRMYCDDKLVATTNIGHNATIIADNPSLVILKDDMVHTSIAIGARHVYNVMKESGEILQPHKSSIFLDPHPDNIAAAITFRTTVGHEMFE